MDIEIKNVDGAISVCDKIISYKNQSASSVDELESILKKIASNWESSGIDKESYILELEKQINNLVILEEQITNLANTIKQYASSMKETSKRTVTD